MAAKMNAWQCIGCGRIEASQPCIGVCQDRKVEFVYASEYEAALVQLERARREAKALEAVVHRLALTKPREGQWERSYRALQDEARRTLAALARAAPASPAQAVPDHRTWQA